MVQVFRHWLRCRTTGLSFSERARRRMATDCWRWMMLDDSVSGKNANAANRLVMQCRCYARKAMAGSWADLLTNWGEFLIL